MEPLKLPKLSYGHLLQLLHCADAHSQGSLNLDENDIIKKIDDMTITQTRQKLPTLNKKQVNPNEKDIKNFMSYLPAEMQTYFLCSRPYVVSSPCTRCGGDIASKDPGEESKFYLEFKEKRAFTTSDEFSKRWEKNMERYFKCTKYQHENHMPVYFMEWPQYLLVNCTQVKMHPGITSFTIGKRSKAEYNLIGAVVLLHKYVVKETRNTYVLFGKTWYLCHGDKLQNGKGEKREQVFVKVEVVQDPFTQANTPVEILLYAKQNAREEPKPNKEIAKQETPNKETSTPKRESSQQEIPKRESSKQETPKKGTNSKHETKKESKVTKDTKPEVDGFVFHIIEPEESHNNEKAPKKNKISKDSQDLPNEETQPNTTKTSTKRATENLTDVAEHKTEKQKREKYNEKEEPNEETKTVLPNQGPPVLRLPNKGNSCWIAACCQLIYCAHTRSNNQAFSFSSTSRSPVIKELSAMMSNSKGLDKSWRRFYNNLFSNIPAIEGYQHEQGDVGQFYECLVEHLEPDMTEESKTFLFCSDIHPTSKGCKCSEKQQQEIDKPWVPFLQYAGSEDFSDSKAFSEEWKICFEYEDTCDWCGKPNLFKNYFRHWPKYLFVLTSSSSDLFKSALQHKFTVGASAQATYAVIGAALHAGASARAGHYVALVKCRDDAWYYCSDDFSHVMDPHKVKGDVQLLLFEKEEQNENEKARKKETKTSSGDSSTTNSKRKESNNEKKDKDEEKIESKKTQGEQEQRKRAKEEKTYENEGNKKQNKPKHGNEINKGIGRQLT